MQMRMNWKQGQFWRDTCSGRWNIRGKQGTWRSDKKARSGSSKQGRSVVRVCVRHLVHDHFAVVEAGDGRQVVLAAAVAVAAPIILSCSCSCSCCCASCSCSSCSFSCARRCGCWRSRSTARSRSCRLRRVAFCDAQRCQLLGCLACGGCCCRCGAVAGSLEFSRPATGQRMAWQQFGEGPGRRANGRGGEAPAPWLPAIPAERPPAPACAPASRTAASLPPLTTRPASCAAA